LPDSEKLEEKEREKRARGTLDSEKLEEKEREKSERKYVCGVK
jgi:hypothetical protein